MELTTEELAYTAGIIDGEGCIKIFKVLAEKINRNFDRYTLNVQVDMVNKDIILWLHERYKGSIHFHKKRNPKHNDSWRWYLCSQQAASFLKLILPYLIVKKNNALNAIEFSEVKAKDPIKEYYFNNSSKLNYRGKEEITIENK